MSAKDVSVEVTNIVANIENESQIPQAPASHELLEEIFKPKNLPTPKEHEERIKQLEKNR